MSNETQEAVAVEVTDDGRPTNGRKLKYPQQRLTLNGAEAKVAEPNKGGRPLKYSSPEQLQQAIDEFFELEKFPTVSGLQDYLDIGSSSMGDYKKREEFSDIIKKGIRKVAVGYEKKLVYGNGRNTAGIIFALKVGMGWRDHAEEKETEQSTIQDNFTKKIEEVNRLYLEKAR